MQAHRHIRRNRQLHLQFAECGRKQSIHYAYHVNQTDVEKE